MGCRENSFVSVSWLKWPLRFFPVLRFYRICRSNYLYPSCSFYVFLLAKRGGGGFSFLEECFVRCVDIQVLFAFFLHIFSCYHSEALVLLILALIFWLVSWILGWWRKQWCGRQSEEWPVSESDLWAAIRRFKVEPLREGSSPVVLLLINMISSYNKDNISFMVIQKTTITTTNKPT